MHYSSLRHFALTVGLQISSFLLLSEAAFMYINMQLNHQEVRFDFFVFFCMAYSVHVKILV